MHNLHLKEIFKEMHGCMSIAALETIVCNSRWALG